MCLTLALGVRVEFRDVGRSIDLPKGGVVQKNFFFSERKNYFVWWRMDVEN